MQGSSQELFYLLKNLRGFLFGTDNPNKKVIGVALVPESSIRLIVKVHARGGFPLFINFPNVISQLDNERVVASFIFLEMVDLFPEPINSICISGVFQIHLSFLPPIKFALHFLHELVQFMEVNIRKDGGADSA